VNTIKSYTWPALLALVSAVTAFSDIMQDTFVANLLAYSLLALGIAAVVFFRAPWISGVAHRAMPRLARDFSPTAFAISCAILGVAVYGFSQLSSRLGDQGGVIAAAYPEIENLQAQLGVVDENVAYVAAVVEQTAVEVRSVADETAFLTKAAGQWLGVESMHLYFDPAKNEGNINLRLDNQSSFVFDNVDIVLRDPRDPNQVLLHKSGIIAQGELKVFSAEVLEGLAEVELCISGRRKQDDLWGKETRIYGKSNMDDMFDSHSVVATDGLRPAGPADRCV